jgi:hypothetical protein
LRAAVTFKAFTRRIDLCVAIGDYGKEKNDSHKGAKHAKFEEIEGNVSLRSWRLGARNFLEVVLLNISRVRI